MSAHRAIPPLLTSCFTRPPNLSLILLTSVLGASTNWLVLRFLTSTLETIPTSAGDHGLIGHSPVVFVSFLRDFAFWRDGGRRVGLDLVKLERDGKIVYVDGLSGLFRTNSDGDDNDSTGAGRVMLRDSGLKEVEKAVLGAVKGGGRKALLIVDGLDLWQAATGQQALAAVDMVLEWRSQVKSTILTVSTDSPLIHSPASPLETHHTTLVTSLAHQAALIMSLRLLDTGTARDVSGVVSVRRGGGRDSDGDGDGYEQDVKEGEWLYFVGGDGAVRVFERGAGG